MEMVNQVRASNKNPGTIDDDPNCFGLLPRHDDGRRQLSRAGDQH